MSGRSSARGHPNPPPVPKLYLCYFAVFGYMEPWADGTPVKMPPCNGKLVKCHLIKRTKLRDAGCGRSKEWADPVWVWGCGGPMGNGGHHGMFDSSRTLRLPRSAIPEETEAIAEQLGLEWWLTDQYGERQEAA